MTIHETEIGALEVEVRELANEVLLCEDEVKRTRLRQLLVGKRDWLRLLKRRRAAGTSA